MESSPMRFLGRISYALYLWNVPVLWTLELKGMPWILAVPIRTAAALGAATASYYLVERPFLRIKARRWSSAPAMASAPANAGVLTPSAGGDEARRRPTSTAAPEGPPRR
jgi:peptidoglycan/LPS O-acetylase OafA/YrhL